MPRLRPRPLRQPGRLAHRLPAGGDGWRSAPLADAAPPRTGGRGGARGAVQVWHGARGPAPGQCPPGRRDAPAPGALWDRASPAGSRARARASLARRRGGAPPARGSPIRCQAPPVDRFERGVSVPGSGGAGHPSWKQHGVLAVARRERQQQFLGGSPWQVGALQPRHVHGPRLPAQRRARACGGPVQLWGPAASARHGQRHG
mmetsp:Transcript_22853/g.54720  ORF Transcript_22853/g.54720 Transcript_22853/m.54720 type:complete len:203 (+) Transcript_22853:482-1090(+)